MKDVLKILIFALALIGLVTLIVHLHWLGAIGVLGIIWNDIKPTSESADRVIDRILNLWDKWQQNRKEADGSREHPFAWEQGMTSYNGKYYTEEGILYLCTRDSGAPLYHPIASLINLYFVVAE